MKCFEDSQCKGDAKRKECYQGQCVECSKNEKCKEGERCIRNKCIKGRFFHQISYISILISNLISILLNDKRKLFYKFFHNQLKKRTAESIVQDYQVHPKVIFQGNIS